MASTLQKLSEDISGTQKEVRELVKKLLAEWKKQTSEYLADTSLKRLYLSTDTAKGMDYFIVRGEDLLLRLGNEAYDNMTVENAYEAADVVDIDEVDFPTLLKFFVQLFPKQVHVYAQRLKEHEAMYENTLESLKKACAEQCQGLFSEEFLQSL